MPRPQFSWSPRSGHSRKSCEDEFVDGSRSLKSKSNSRIIHKFSQIITNRICGDGCRFVEPILKTYPFYTSLHVRGCLRTLRVRLRRIYPPIRFAHLRRIPRLKKIRRQSTFLHLYTSTRLKKTTPSLPTPTRLTPSPSSPYRQKWTSLPFLRCDRIRNPQNISHIKRGITAMRIGIHIKHRREPPTHM